MNALNRMDDQLKRHARQPECGDNYVVTVRLKLVPTKLI